MKIALVNDIHVGKPLRHNGILRASSHLMESVLEEYLTKICRQHAPDLMINLGDLIRTESKSQDLEAYGRLMAIFKEIDTPVIHLVGNHEIEKMPLNAIEDLWKFYGFNQKSYGLLNTEECTLIWLGLEMGSDRRTCLLPLEQLEWLKEVLSTITLPTLVFIHCPFDDHNMSGNFFYEAMDSSSSSFSFLGNQEAVRSVIAESGRVVAVLQAHLHDFHAKQIGKTSYITCPAMGDNLCSLNNGGSVAHNYTILNFNQNHLLIKAFSGTYCFAGYEIVSDTNASRAESNITNS